MGSWSVLNVENKNELTLEATERVVESLPSLTETEKNGDLYQAVASRAEPSLVVEAWGGLTDDQKSAIERIYFVIANNTSDSASIYVFENIYGELEEVEVLHGYEAARGADVAGQVSEKYGVRPRVYFT